MPASTRERYGIDPSGQYSIAHAPAPGQNLAQPLVQLTIPRVGRDDSRLGVGMLPASMRWTSSTGSPSRGTQVRPAAREQVTAEVEGRDCGGVLAAEVPQQPAIERPLGERVLDLSDRELGTRRHQRFTMRPVPR